MTDADLLSRFETDAGFIAALDQSGGSSPKALSAYGIDPSQYSTDAEMFALINAERARIVSSPAFTGDRILAAILFEATLDYEVRGRRFTDYLRDVKRIIPLLKIDQGLQDRADDVQLMRDIPDLDRLLGRAREARALGTKERSVIHAANPAGIDRIVDQQFALAERVLAAGLLPIIEPEIDITAPDKGDAEVLLKQAILDRLDSLGERRIAVKISIPSVDGFYSDLIADPRIARVVALSGGYDRAEADARLARNPGLIASFSRALLEGLSVQQTDDEFDSTLGASIGSIYAASIT